MCHSPARHAAKQYRAVKARFVRIWDEANTGREISPEALFFLDVALDAVMRQLDDYAQQLGNVEAQPSVVAILNHSEAPSTQHRSLNPPANPGVLAESQQQAQRPGKGVANGKRQSPTGEEDSGGSPNKRRTTQDRSDFPTTSQDKQTTKLSSHGQSSNSRHQLENSTSQSSVPTGRTAPVPELPGIQTLLLIEQEGDRKNRGSTLPALSTLRLPTSQSTMPVMGPPVMASTSSGQGAYYEAAHATLPPLQPGAEAQQYHARGLPLTLLPDPQDPNHQPLPEHASAGQGAVTTQYSTYQGSFSHTQRPHVGLETYSSPHSEPLPVTANATLLSPSPRSARNALSAEPLSEEDEVMLDDGTKFKVIRDSKHRTTYEKL